MSSSSDLARALISAPAAVQDGDANTDLKLHAGVLKDVLNDNREQLIAQNILEEGNTREEAEAAIDLLLAAVGYFQDASLTLKSANDNISASFSIRVADQ